MIIRVLKDDEAVVLMVDSNLQREMISPSEKAFAYKMKYEAIKRKAGRRKCGQVDHNLGKKSIELIGEECGDSPKQVQLHRFFQVTYTAEQMRREILEMLKFSSYYLQWPAPASSSSWFPDFSSFFPESSAASPAI